MLAQRKFVEGASRQEAHDGFTRQALALAPGPALLHGRKRFGVPLSQSNPPCQMPGGPATPITCCDPPVLVVGAESERLVAVSRLGAAVVDESELGAQLDLVERLVAEVRFLPPGMDDLVGFLPADRCAVVRQVGKYRKQVVKVSSASASAACMAATWSPMLVPGLLQTERYARESSGSGVRTDRA
jgi:hypothetical protein